MKEKANTLNHKRNDRHIFDTNVYQNRRSLFFYNFQSNYIKTNNNEHIFRDWLSMPNSRGPQKRIFAQLKKDRRAFSFNLKLIFGGFRSK